MSRRSGRHPVPGESRLVNFHPPLHCLGTKCPPKHAMCNARLVEPAAHHTDLIVTKWRVTVSKKALLVRLALQHGMQPSSSKPMLLLRGLRAARPKKWGGEYQAWKRLLAKRKVPGKPEVQRLVIHTCPEVGGCTACDGD